MANSASLHRAWNHFGSSILDFLFPPRCLACGQDVDRAGGVCAGCWGRLTFVTHPLCTRCGLPFDFDTGEDTLCGACIASAPPFDGARAALSYNAASRPLLIGLKHDRLHGVTTMAEWMERAGKPFLAEADLICAVPLHRWRLLKRGYNQAALLAQAIAKRNSLPVIPDLLLRHRATVSQGGLSRSGRQRNIRGAFAINPRWREGLAGATVILVDDVFTTGATIGECCRVLRKSGAAYIYVLCAARVIAPVTRG